jgi:arylsulfatase A-like enzyme
MRTLILALVLALSFPSFRSASAASSPPNIVFILADDLGYTDVATFGSRYYETPNIDKLASQGLKLTSHHHCQNCQPTRAALMTGQYAPRTGVYTVGGIDRFDWQSRPLRPVDNADKLPLDKILIAQQLKAAGYATGMFGKWHLGEGEEHHPAKRGFDEAIVTAGQHFNFRTKPSVEYPKGEYLADFLTGHAEAFIRKHKDHPFFLYLPHFGVHSPKQAKEALIAKFQAKPGVGGHNDPVYAAMIASVDESVGRVMTLLDELKLAENTVLIFSSDNGGVGGYERAGLVNKEGITDNAPLKGGKGMFYEGGVRVPYIFSWKGKIAAGMKNDTPINSVDLYPTLVEVAGAERPHDYTLDGESYAPLLAGAKSKLDRDAIYWHFPGYLGAGTDQWRTTPVSSIHAGDWKLMEFFEDGKQELYNLKNDIGEEHNVAKENPDKVKELHAKLVAWREQVGAKMPTPNTDLKKDVKNPKRKKNARKNRANDD